MAWTVAPSEDGEAMLGRLEALVDATEEQWLEA